MRVTVSETVFSLAAHAAAACDNDQRFTAALYGLQLSAERLAVLACVHPVQLKLVESALPGGLELVGVMSDGDSGGGGDEVMAEWPCIDRSEWLVELSTDRCSLRNAADGSNSWEAAVGACRVRQQGEYGWQLAEQCEVVGAVELARLVILLAAPCSLPLPPGKSVDAVAELRRKWRGEARLAFLWRPGAVLLRALLGSETAGEGGVCVGAEGPLDDCSCCEALLSAPDSADPRGKTPLVPSLHRGGCLSVDCCLSVVQDHRSESTPASALTLHVSRHSAPGISLRPRRLTLSCLAVVGRQQPLRCAALALTSAADRQLALFESALADADGDADATLCHFQPLSCSHPLVWVHRVGAEAAGSTHDLAVEACRRRLHAALLLPRERPALRLSNCRGLLWPGHGASTRAARALSCLPGVDPTVLVNVHLAVSRPDWARGREERVEMALVHGDYSYHHYGQQGVDDAGWGCAYRSLQTLASWFLWQGCVDTDSSQASVPTHRAIQQCLVRIGDKPGSFIGSRQWIGSAEVGFCLESLLDVTSRMLHVARGADMTSGAAHQLLRHFRAEGTPVMVGGGQLAHTLLGVALEEESGTAHFLVLDPHYTAAYTDLHTVIRKGWCGWKSEQFWDQTAYYNLCMPLRPREL